MQKFLALLIISVILFAGLYCSKTNSSVNNNSNNNNNGNDTTKPSAVGLPTGPSVTKFISASGGSLATADGRVEIDIPAGALPKGDTITIQNITNTAQTSHGDAYRFLPNGLKFNTPVTIEFHYTDDDINGSAPELLDVAYQDSAGNWQDVDSSSLDTVSRTISAYTSHFTDYIDFQFLSLFPTAGSMIPPNNLMVGKSETFKVIGPSTKNVGVTVDLDRFYDLSLQSSFNWQVNDDPGNPTYGTAVDATGANSGLSASIALSAACVYTAPQTVPKSNNPVRLSIEIVTGIIQKWVESHRSMSISTHRRLITTKASVKVPYNIKIIDGKVYRIDIVDWEDLGSGGTVNYYDSASVWIKINPDLGASTFTYNISQDSIINIPPVAYPTTATPGAGNCTYLWIPEPIGTVNITSGTVYYSSYPSSNTSFFVNVTLQNTNANSAWATVACGGTSGTVTSKAGKPDAEVPVPFIVDISASHYSQMLIGTEDKDHVRVSLDTLGPGQ